jgi:hypothetical protein
MKLKYLLLISILCLGCGQNIEQIKNDLLPNIKIFVENEIKEDTVKSFLKFDTIFINRIDTLTPKERSTYFANLLTWKLDFIKLNSNSIRDLLNITKNRSYLKYYGYDSYSNDIKEWKELDSAQKYFDKEIVQLYSKTIDSLRNIKDSVTQYNELYSAFIKFRYVKNNFTLDSGSRYIWFNKKYNLIEPNKEFDNIFSELNKWYEKSNDLYTSVIRH